MAQVAVPLAATAFSVAGKVQQGRAANAAAKNDAAVMEANARRRLEQGEFQAAEVRRRTIRDMSDAQAAQASSGFAASDAQALRQRAEIAKVGRQNELAYLYEAEMDAQAMRRGADNRRAEGRAARTSAYLGAGATAFGSYAGHRDNFVAWREGLSATGPNSAPVVSSTPAWQRPYVGTGTRPPAIIRRPI